MLKNGNKFDIGNWMIGSDFEYVYTDELGNPVSSIGRIGGTKDKPLSLGRGCARQEDNVLTECNIPPVQDFESFVDYIDYCISSCNKIMDVYNLIPSFKSSHRFPKKELKHPNALEFGCSPSWNVYTEEIINIDRDPKDPLRSSALHIHFGHPTIAEGEGTDWNRIERIIKWCDIYLGLPSVLLDPDKERRKLYGQAGEFRMQKHGVEYRVLGSYFLTNSKLLEFVWEGSMKVIESCDMEIVSDPLVEEAINNSDIALARELCVKYNIPIKQIEEYA